MDGGSGGGQPVVVAQDERVREQPQRGAALKNALGTFERRLRVASTVRIWRDAAWLWLLSRAIFLALTFLVPGLLLRGAQGSLLVALHRWVTQDGYHLAFIAANGYTPVWRTAYWPLFPALERAGGPLFGGDYGLAGLVIANLAYFAALVALRALGERELGPEAARRAAIYLTLFPTAFYLFAPYTESLFLALTVAAFAALRSRRWALAGALGLLATLTRSAGLLLVIPFAIEFLMAWRARRAAWWQGLWVALIPLAVGLYGGYLQVTHHNALAFSHSESWWGRSLQWPWTVVVLGIQGLGTAHGGLTIAVTHLALNLGALLVLIALSVVALRLLPLSYGLYALGLTLWVSIFPVGNSLYAAQSISRYALMIFPIFLVLGAVSLRPRFAWLHEALLIGMTPLLAIACASYLLGLASG